MAKALSDPIFRKKIIEDKLRTKLRRRQSKHDILEYMNE